MKEKLTLSINRETKKRAKQYARKKGTSVSKIVEYYLSQLSTAGKEWQPQKGSAVERMSGVIQADKDFDYDTVIVQERMKKYEDHSN